MQELESPAPPMAQPTLKVRVIVPGENYREHYDLDKMAELEEGVKAVGRITSPVQVRPHPTHDGIWQIIAGERRLIVARKVLGDDYDMPVVVTEATDIEARALGIIENHFRDDPGEMEQAKGAAQLLQLLNNDKAETAKRLGWDLSTLDSRLLLLNCAVDVQSALISRRIKLGHGELLAGLPKERQSKVLAGVLEHRVPVAVLKRQLGQFSKLLADAIFDTQQCGGCPHNSSSQAALFDESVGQGYCQHPDHFDELTLAALTARAEPLRERFQVVKIFKASDGFTPLPVAPDGPLGVGDEQYAACKGCANFGCSVSAVPGSYGEVQESLCFNADCHATKVSDRRKAERAASRQEQVATGGGSVGSKGSPQAAQPLAAAKRASNHTPPRVVQYREERWRNWAANGLMADPGRNHRVLAALIASSSLQSFDSGKFVEAVVKLVKPAKFGANGFKSALEQAHAFEDASVPAVVKAVTASAAYGIDVQGLEVVLNYLEVDEAKHFKLSADYLELLTVSELESLADELKLRKAMGDAAFKRAKAGTKAKFIEALLAINGVEYAGLVPKAMRYSRKRHRFSLPAEGTASGSELQSEPGSGPVEEASALAGA